MLASAVLLLQLSRSLWFFGDDWEFLLHRSVTETPLHTLFRPHNEHWVTIPVIEYRILYSLFGIRYLPFAAVVVILHVLVVCTLYLLLRRVGASAWPAVIGTVTVAFAGAGAEDLLWAFQSEFVGPVLLALLALTVTESMSPGLRRTGVVWVLLVAGLMCSGMGVTMTCWVAAFALVRNGWRSAVATAFVPAVVYVSWLLTFGSSSTDHSSALRMYIPSAMLTGAANIWQQVVPLPGVGGPMILVLALASLVAPAPAALRALARAGMLALVPFLLLLSYSRVALAGEQAATASRYVYLGLVLTIPAFVVALSWLAAAVSPEPVVAVIGGVLIAALLMTSGIGSLLVFHQQRETAIGDSRARLVAGVGIAQGGAVVVGSLDPTYSPDITTASLRDRVLRSRLPQVRTGPQSRLDAAGGLQVGIGAERLDDVPTTSSLTFRGPGQVTERDRCLSGYSTGGHLQLTATDGGGQFSLETSGTTVSTLLIRGRVKSHPVARGVPPGTSVWVGTSADAELRVRLPSGYFRACR
ncbi:hypothetical protein D9V37_07105 [Nocardioides mangrovicus]|uniref:Glycosyltransferase RgtA/B/C/D-like domain-containing protein n=1 Tax=Nocardioides mangrovicus TaxID=2478913 RepID=A0A3L8P5K0_9ACTN|nr:hypothetical protein D9V37_07105 [Nocardioides mangrovicus]